MVLELMATPSFAWTPKGSTGPLDKIAVHLSLSIIWDGQMFIVDYTKKLNKYILIPSTWNYVRHRHLQQAWALLVFFSVGFVWTKPQRVQGITTREDSYSSQSKTCSMRLFGLSCMQSPPKVLLVINMQKRPPQFSYTKAIIYCR